MVKPVGNNTSETFQGRWGGTSTERRFPLGCVSVPGQLLAPARACKPQKIFGGGRSGCLILLAAAREMSLRRCTRVQSVWTSNRIWPRLSGQQAMGHWGWPELSWSLVWGCTGGREGTAALGEQPCSAKWPCVEEQCRPGLGSLFLPPAPPAAFKWPSWPQGPFAGAAGARLPALTLARCPRHCPWHSAPWRAGAGRPGQGMLSIKQKSLPALGCRSALF